MTIKEIETRAGMSRANVRFYEAEGLLAPTRLENGYRDYSEADLRELTRIKLLRSLRVPLSDIRALQTGEKRLADVLSVQLDALNDAQDELELAKELCRAIREDGADYAGLDAEKYLFAAEKAAPPPAPPAPVSAPSRPAAPTPPELRSDVLPRLRAPWRRWFARALDWSFYTALLELLLIGAFRVSPLGRDAAHTLVFALFVLLLRLFLEPLFLTLFGGTPGKLLLGLRVTDNEGRRLSYRAALSRTFSVFVYAEGLTLPIVHLIRLVKSYQICMHGEEEYRQNPWEYDSEQTLRDERLWRVFAYLAALALLIALPAWADHAAATAPANTGELTVAEFCENFNRLADYNGIALRGSRLSAAGEWEKQQREGGVIIYVGVLQEEPAFVFTEEDGRMTGLRFTCSHKEPKSFFAPDLRAEAILAVRAYAGALARTGEERQAMNRLLGRIERGPFESVEEQIGEVRVVIDCAVSGGAAPGGDVLFCSDFRYEFSMTRAG